MDMICDCWQCRGDTEAPEWAEVREEDEVPPWLASWRVGPPFKPWPEVEVRAFIEDRLLAGHLPDE